MRASPACSPSARGGACGGRSTGRSQHVQATTPGELVCFDTFYIGKLKGIGKVWQYTACDAAYSYAVARLSTEFSTEAAAQFFREVVAHYTRTGWAVRRVLSDLGNEYRGAFDAACRGLHHIYAVSSVEHFGISGRHSVKTNEPEAGFNAVGEIRRVLKAGGRFLLTRPLRPPK